MDPDLDLEDPDSPRSAALVEEGNAEVARRLGAAADEDRAPLRAIIEDPDKLFACRLRGGFLYDFHRSQAHPRGLWRRVPADVAPAADAPWEAVLDLDALWRETGEEWAWRGPAEAPDGRRALIHLSRDGADVGVSREFDLEAKAFVAGGFETPLCRHDASWDGRDRLLIAAATGEGHATRSGWPRTVRAWDRGAALDAAPVVHAAEEGDIAAGAAREHGEGTLLLHVAHTITESTLLAEDERGRRALPLPRAAAKWANGRFAAWVPREDGDHPAGALVLRSFRGEAFERRLAAPSPRGAVSGVLLSRDWLVAWGHEGLVPWLRALDLSRPEGRLRDLPLPEGATSAGPRWLAAPPWTEGPLGRDARLDVVAEGMLLPPTLLRVDLAEPSALLAPVARAKASFDAADMTASLREAVAPDATAIPYHLALPREAADGPVPVVMTAYGGFDIPATATYARLWGASLLERGIGVAVAHVRGGGEFGPSWHKAALRERRPVAFADAAAVARDLVARGVAPARGVGFVGGSNGGLLACALAVFHPDAFGAIKADVPVTDMLRFHRLTAGAAWIEEYGDPDDPGDAAHLRAWSPLHNVPPRSRVACPPLLIAAPAHDDRVDPSHARKFYRAMREAGQDVLLRTSGSGGHGGGEASDRQAEDAAVEAAFFRLHLAHPRP